VADARSERHPAVPRRPGGPGGSSQVEQRRRGHFLAESLAELKKVEWPGQNQVIQGTVVVLIACFVVGAYLYANDIVWKHVVSKVFLGQ
jgi:preprotein translocase subunit SecE